MFQLTTIHRGHNFKTDVMFSASLFRMKDAYRNFSKYVNYTLQLIDQIRRIYPEASLRIYIDRSVHDSERHQFFKDFTEVVEFHYVAFWLPESNTHEGVFGTFARFIPLFDSRQKGTVIVCDVDIPDGQIEFLKDLAEKSPADSDLALVNATHKNAWMPDDNKFTIIAYGIVGFYRFPKRLLTNFLKGLESGKYVMKWEGRKNIVEAGRLPYGTDEWFMNNIFYTYLTTIHAKVFMITRDTAASSIKSIYYSMDSLKRKRFQTIIETLNSLDSLLWVNPYQSSLKRIHTIVSKLYEDPEFKEHILKSRNKDSIQRYIRDGKLVFKRSVQL